ncbi:MAG: hypothetical protein NVSMB14_09110 [Isosphaeraceae bacterium]
MLAQSHLNLEYDCLLNQPIPPTTPRCVETSGREVFAALVLAIVAVLATRLPVARPSAFDFDETGFLETIDAYRFPMHHTLFLAGAKVLGDRLGDAYRGFVAIDMITSAGALVAVWWWLRAIVRPSVALATTCVLAASPVFWTYGAMAGNYTAIPLVGSFLLGIALRGWTAPKSWHPFAAAAVFALGTGYRQDIGTFWMPVFLTILWRHRWIRASLAGFLFAGVCAIWFGLMLEDAGGWNAWRSASKEFAYKAGYLNSVWNLGWIDAPLRYLVKMGMALVWTLGPGLLFVPRGAARLWTRIVHGKKLSLLLLCAAVLPAASHLLVHFGVPGYAMHYVPALIACAALGIGPLSNERATVARLSVLATGLAAVFLLYPTDYERPGLRGDFDLAFARSTRLGLKTPTPRRDPNAWRTVNSQELPDGPKRAENRRESLSDLLP